MYIKQIKISKFVIYNEECVMENFGPDITLVIGKNGSGKSTVFSAIRFVFDDIPDDELSRMLQFFGKSEELARVSVTLADTQDCFPEFGSEVTIQRAKSTSRDSYTINGRSIAKTVLFSQLTMAGLSRDAGRFYIVPQGEVSTLALADPKTRLEKLLAFSGVHTFDNYKTKAESRLSNTQKELKEIEVKIEQLQSHFVNIHFQESQLREYMNLEMDGFTRQAYLYSIEIATMQDHLAEAESNFQELTSSRSDLQTQLDDASVNLEDARGKLLYKSSELRSAEEELDVLQSELSRDTRDLVDLEKPTSDGTALDQALERDYYSVMQNTTRSKESLEHEINSYKLKLQAEESEISNSLAEIENMRKQIMEKQRELASSQLANVSEESSIEYINNLTSKSRLFPSESVDQLNDHLNDLREQRLKVVEQVEKLRELNSEVETCVSERDGISGEVSQLDQSFKETTINLRRTTIDLDRSEKEIETTLKGASGEEGLYLNGLYAVQKLLDSEVLSSVDKQDYLGTLAEYVNVPMAYEQATNAVCGTNFHINLVTNDDIIEKISEAMNNKESGLKDLPMRISFLNVHSNEFKEPEANTLGFPRLSDELKVLSDETSQAPENQIAQVKSIIGGMFRRYIVCPSVDEAVQTSSENPVTAVTPQGDVFEHKGPIHGGKAQSSSRGSTNMLTRHARVLKLRSLLKEKSVKTKKLTELETKIDELNQQKLAKQNEMYPITSKLSSLMTKIGGFHDNHALNEQLKFLDKEILITERNLENVRKDVEAYEELRSSLIEQRNQGTLISSNAEIEAIEQELADLEFNLEENNSNLRSHQNKFEIYKTQLQDLESEITRATLNEAAQSEHRDNQTRKELKDAIKKLKTQISKLDQTVNTLRAERDIISEEFDFEESRYKELLKSSDALKRKIDRTQIRSRAIKKLQGEFISKREALPALDLSWQAKIPEFEEMSSKQRKLTSRKYEKELEELEREKEKFDYIDRSAADKRYRLHRELLDLQGKHADLGKICDELAEVMTKLDNEKRERFNSFLKNVSTKFTYNFELLSDGVRAFLKPEYKGDDESEVLSVDIAVEGIGTTRRLSGGQLTMCALSIIFAVQAANPSPFYLFDEVDANLDYKARERLAMSVRRSSERNASQFILTTFHPEFVTVADHFYGIGADEVGRPTISIIDRDLAYEFTEPDKDHA